jgi:type IV pilus assembly protein PilX
MSPNRSSLRVKARQQHGGVLIVLLILLMVVTLLGVALMRTQTTEQRMAVNSANRSIAAANAETTLRWGECGLQGGCDGAGWLPTLFLSNTAGLYSLNPSSGSTVSSLTPNNSTTATWSAPAGSSLPYNGTSLGAGVSAQYVVERLPPVVIPGDSSSLEQYNGGGGAIPYQVTAYATGADTSSKTVLQSTFRP